MCVCVCACVCVCKREMDSRKWFATYDFLAGLERTRDETRHPFAMRVLHRLLHHLQIQQQ